MVIYCIHLCLIVKSTKVHLYWAMKNCSGTKEDLQKRVLNIGKCYQVRTELYMLTF